MSWNGGVIRQELRLIYLEADLSATVFMGISTATFLLNKPKLIFKFYKCALCLTGWLKQSAAKQKSNCLELVLNTKLCLHKSPRKSGFMWLFLFFVLLVAASDPFRMFHRHETQPASFSNPIWKWKILFDFHLRQLKSFRDHGHKN